MRVVTTMVIMVSLRVTQMYQRAHPYSSLVTSVANHTEPLYPAVPRVPHPPPPPHPPADPVSEPVPKPLTQPLPSKKKPLPQPLPPKEVPFVEPPVPPREDRGQGTARTKHQREGQSG